MIRRIKRLGSRVGHWMPKFGTPATLVVIALTLLVLASGQATAKRQRSDIAQRQMVQERALEGIGALVSTVKAAEDDAKAAQSRVALVTSNPLDALKYNQGIATVVCLLYRQFPPLPPTVSKVANCPKVYADLGLVR